MNWYLVYTLTALNVVVAGWLVFLTVKYRRLYQKAEVIFNDANPQKLATMLERYFQNIEEVNENHKKLQRILKSAKITAERGLNRVGFLRYNPFGDIGSDQSFSMCLLNSSLDGFVISSIHSREGTRVYAKPVSGGVPAYNTSAEEQRVIKMAIGKEVKNKNLKPATESFGKGISPGEKNV